MRSPTRSPRKARRNSGALLALLCLLPGLALGQQSLLQGSSMTAGHLPTYSIGGTSQPIVIDSGPAGGNVAGQGISELNVTARGTGTAPYASQGTGPNGEIACVQDAVSTNSTGFHYLCLSANAAGGGLISYGAAGGASTLPFTLKVNGTAYSFPFVTSGIVGPGTTVVNDMACWNNTVGTLLKDCGVPLAVGGSANQVQYNSAGVLGGFTVGGDATLVVGTGALTVSKIGGTAISLAGALTHAGAFTQTFTATANTALTLPTTGTLATLAGAEALTNKSYNGLAVTASTGTLTIVNAKTLTVSNTVGVAGTDGSTLNIGAGGTLGTAAFTAASAYIPSATQITASLAPVNLSNVATFFDGAAIAQGSTGTWFACATINYTNATAAGSLTVKLWDGTTSINQAIFNTNGLTLTIQVPATVCGYLATPAGNLRVSVKDTLSTAGNFTSSIYAFRVQ